MFQLLTNHRARSGRRLFKVIVGLSVVGLYAPVACIATGDDTEERERPGRIRPAGTAAASSLVGIRTRWHS